MAALLEKARAPQPSGRGASNSVASAASIATRSNRVAAGHTQGNSCTAPRVQRVTHAIVNQRRLNATQYRVNGVFLSRSWTSRVSSGAYRQLQPSGIRSDSPAPRSADWARGMADRGSGPGAPRTGQESQRFCKWKQAKPIDEKRWATRGPIAATRFPEGVRLGGPQTRCARAGPGGAGIPAAAPGSAMSFATRALRPGVPPRTLPEARAGKAGALRPSPPTARGEHGLVDGGLDGATRRSSIPHGRLVGDPRHGGAAGLRLRLPKGPRRRTPRPAHTRDRGARGVVAMSARLRAGRTRSGSAAARSHRPARGTPRPRRGVRFRARPPQSA